MPFDLQPVLENGLVSLKPLREEDFERLYSVAADPLVWEQHPNKNRYEREVFQNFFKGAMASGGAFLISDVQTGEVIGSSRYYEVDEENGSVAIGYTFFDRKCWGKGHNPATKALMLGHAFTYFDKVIFHIGAENVRSQVAIQRIGAKKIGELVMPYFGEPDRFNFVYCIEKKDWH